MFIVGGYISGIERGSATMLFDKEILEQFWNDIPIGKENAITYDTLCDEWSKNKRDVRHILHELSSYDNGDDYVLIRSGGFKGFFRTNDTDIIGQYRKECLNKGRSIFAPVRKCNRILKTDLSQMNFENNLRMYRLEKGLTQKEVCEKLNNCGIAIDESLLSKLENSVALPTPAQVHTLAKIYGSLPVNLFGATYPYEVR